ncbi:TetR/AcrR family transcriptional regulator [Nocardioides speluncae]|uniref:TetR/AcrR family transcriptional regulator n=1 Tax=Nocardioides speluncae TaxID=2670337 RepID=UPI001379C521|nr:TetR/AcrR family transcriptional regulator [Nocardioides speluncae]
MVRQYAATSPEALTEALFDVAAESGLDAATVRVVAARAGVSIGAVQHHFATKDQMYAAAFAALVARVRARIGRVDLTAPLPERLLTVLAELLPLDKARTREARVMAAFAARAATSPSLAAIQAAQLAEIRAELTEALGDLDHAEQRAAVLFAAVDGLALHAVSSGGGLKRHQLTAALEELVRRFV